VPGDVAGFAVAPALLVGGIGGGFTISPNITMTLRNVPVRMAGSAGGALQTGQRVGAAVGTALVAGVFYGVLAAAGDSYPAAIAGALAVAVLTTAVALGIAIVDLRRQRQALHREDAASPHHVSHD